MVSRRTLLKGAGAVGVSSAVGVSARSVFGQNEPTQSGSTELPSSKELLEQLERHETTMSSSQMIVGIDSRRGVLTSIVRKSDPLGLNYLGNLRKPSLSKLDWSTDSAPDVQKQTKTCTFAYAETSCDVYEDLTTRDGVITFVAAGQGTKQLTTTTEGVFSTAKAPFFGMELAELSKADEDMLARHILQGGGDPDPQVVRDAVPPLVGCTVGQVPYTRDIWNTIIGTKQCEDAMPVYPGGNTRNYFPVQRHPGFAKVNVDHRWEGMLGGWMPAVRKVFPLASGAYYEVLVFAEVDSAKPHITDTWHRTSLIQHGKVVERTYGFSYPEFPPFREAPPAEEFYKALLRFVAYWEGLLKDVSGANLPEQWNDLSKHAFVKELISRPGGVYPRYGAVDEDYASPVYDAFQDTFTTSLYSNLEWGRLEMARSVFDNYYSEFVDDRGLIDMRGPEVGQYGLTLSLIAKYFQYTRDEDLLRKHRQRIEATAGVLTTLHDESLRLSPSDPGQGLIHGWSESDSCLWDDPQAYWQPYYSNSALAARGLQDLAAVWRVIHWSTQNGIADDWEKRSRALKERTVASMRANLLRSNNRPYIGPLPGVKATFQQAQYTEKPNIQQWPHRLYSELLQADILPPDLTTTVVDTLKANGGTTAGVVADIWPVLPEGRKILGFISYSYALALLRLDRIEEFLLFMYSHRYHDHTRGSWTAMETRHIGASTNLFCMPAQQSLPLLVRWMLLMEESDSEILHVARGVPRAWFEGGQRFGISNAPTRWGRAGFTMCAKDGHVTASIHLDGQQLPRELHVKVRLPKHMRILEVSLNGRPAQMGGTNGETLKIPTGNQRAFEIDGRLA